MVGPSVPEAFAAVVLFVSRAQTIPVPLVVPAEETTGVVPGKPYPCEDCDVATVLNWLVEVLSAKAFRACPTPAIYMVFCQNAAVEKILPPRSKACTTLSGFALCPMVSRFTT